MYLKKTVVFYLRFPLSCPFFSVTWRVSALRIVIQLKNSLKLSFGSFHYVSRFLSRILALSKHTVVIVSQKGQRPRHTSNRNSSYRILPVMSTCEPMSVRGKGLKSCKVAASLPHIRKNHISEHVSTQHWATAVVLTILLKPGVNSAALKHLAF